MSRVYAPLATAASSHKIQSLAPLFRWLWSVVWGPRLEQTADDPEFDQLSEHELLHLMRGDAESMLIGKLGIFGRPLQIYRITRNTVAKFAFRETIAYEPYTMSLVSSQTSVRVPRLRRFILDSQSKGLWIFMQYIDGDDLENLWPTLSLWRKLRIVWTLRSYVHQLRRIKLSNSGTPGPIDGSGNPLPCKGRWFSELGTLPFPAYSDLSAWFRRRLDWTLELERRFKRPSNKSNLPRFDDSRPLVLTHGDMALRNIRIAEDGTVWLLDWGLAGVYPEWFEYAAILNSANDSPTQKEFLFFAPVIAGWYAKQVAFLDRIRLGLSPRFPTEEDLESLRAGWAR